MTSRRGESGQDETWRLRWTSNLLHWQSSKCFIAALIYFFSTSAFSENFVDTCTWGNLNSHANKGAFYAHFFVTAGWNAWCFGAFAESAQGACEDVLAQAKTQGFSVDSVVAVPARIGTWGKCAFQPEWWFGSLAQLREPISNTIQILGDGFAAEPWNKKRDPGHNKANLAYTAKVMDQNGQPKANISVKITSDATQDSGGHVHTSGRPKGKLIAGTSASISTRDGTATLSGTTDADGKFQFVFGAEEASGTHTITAKCSGCGNTATATIKAAIEGLTLLGADPLSYDLVGSLDWHPGNHYVSEEAVVQIINLALTYKKKFNALLIINDSSLIKGGVFDLGQDWTYEFSGHAGHRTGVVVDTNNYSDKRNTDFEKLASNSGIDAQWHTKGTAPHYHLLLLGTGRDE